jgi:hypothetical protein
MRAIEPDTDESARELLGGDQRRARAAERIEHGAALAKGLDEGTQDLHRLLRRMQPVAGIGPVERIRHRRCRRRDVALGEEISLLVLVAQETRR